MIHAFVRERDGDALVTVRVRPRGGRDAIDGVRGDALLVRVAAPPAGGEANEAVRRLVAKACRVAPSRVSIVRGQRGRDKVIRIEGVGANQVVQRLLAGASERCA
jgi:uncharacterized protein